MLPPFGEWPPGLRRYFLLEWSLIQGYFVMPLLFGMLALFSDTFSFICSLFYFGGKRKEA